MDHPKCCAVRFSARAVENLIRAVKFSDLTARGQ